MKRITLCLVICIFSFSITISQQTFEKVFPVSVYGGDVIDLTTTSDGNCVIIIQDELIKIDQNGNELWRKSVQSSSHSVSETSDNGFILSGNKLTKLDVNGNMEWESTMNGGVDAKQTSDGGYIMATANLSIRKADANGDQVWETGSYETPGLSSDAYSVIETSDGGYAMCGQKIMAGFDDMFFVAKVNANGGNEWTKTKGNPNFNDGAFELINTSDNNLVVVGYTSPNGSIHSIWLIKYNVGGTELWSKLYNKGAFTEGMSVAQTSDNGFIILGHNYDFNMTHSEINLIKTNANGVEQWSKVYGVGAFSFGKSICAANDGGYVFLGECNFSMTTFESNPYLVKTDANGSVGFLDIFKESGNVSIFPSPATDFITAKLQFTNLDGNIEVAVYDLMGKIVYNKILGKHISEVKIDIQNYKSGVYFLKLSAQNSTEIYSSKFVVQKK